MGQGDIDIDRIVDYEREYREQVRNARRSGDNIVGCCPFHDDRNASFSADIRTGKWTCFASCGSGNFTTFWARLRGVGQKEAYKEILRKYGVETAERGGQGEPDGDPRDYTLARYAAQKMLPADWLARSFKLRDGSYRVRDKDADGGYAKVRAVFMPYLDAEGKELPSRVRYVRKGTASEKEMRWEPAGKGGGKSLYGEWIIPEMLKARKEGSRYVVLVEGESDTQTLVYLNIPALGVPGASMFRAREAGLLAGFDTVYIHQEPDGGGERFVRGVCKGLLEGGFKGQVRAFTCKGSGVKDPSGLYMKKGKEEAKAVLMGLLKAAEALDVAAASEPPTVAGIPWNPQMPAGWSLSEGGVFMEDPKAGTKLACRAPLTISRRLISIDTGEEKVELWFKRDGTARTGVYQRSTAFTARSVTELANIGCTVTSENARQVVRYLMDLENTNIDRIPRARSTDTLGWKEDERHFLPGHDGGIVLDVEPSLAGWAAACRTRGTLAGWADTMRGHRERDRFRFVLAAGLAAPILRPLRQRAFFVYNWGNSKGGKTAGLKAALSAWGDPDGLLVTFNATQVAMERLAGFFNDIPLGIDERQLAGEKQEKLDNIVYMVSNGKGRVRGSKTGGLQRMQSWLTVALATGEEPLSSETSMTGTTTRTIEIYGGPFLDELSASRMHQDAPDNCGHAGPYFVGRIMRTDRAELKAELRRVEDMLREAAPGAAGPHTSSAAVVALADELMETWIFSRAASELDGGEAGTGNIPLEIPDYARERAVQMAASVLIDQMAAGNADVNERAAQYALDWILSNRASFEREAAGRRLGFLSDDGSKAYVFPSIFDQALTEAGYSARKTKRYLAESGVISSNAVDRRGTFSYSVVKWFAGKTGRFVEFNLDAWGGGRPEGDFVQVSEDDLDAMGLPKNLTSK